MLEVASYEKLVVVDLVSIRVPAIKVHEGVYFLNQFILNGAVLVHVNILDQVVDADLGRGHSRSVDSFDVI